MATVTMFFPFEHHIDQHTFILYKPDNTYADVPADVAERITRCGLGEIVPDEILTADPNEADPLPIKNPRRRKVSKKWQ